MKETKTNYTPYLINFFLASLIVVLGSFHAFGQTTALKGKAFGSAEEAAAALIDAAEKFDAVAIRAILGPDSMDIIDTGEPYRDRELVREFAALGRTKQNITYNPRNKTSAILEVGNDNWPFPLPIVKRGKSWYFDTATGRKELIQRRIGSNEYDAMTVCDKFVEAQIAYAATKHDDNRVNQYAQRMISSPGKKDGLAWQNTDGTWAGHISDETAKMLANVYTGEQAPFYGYFFKILKAQGPAAPGGELNYVQNGAMIGGFALVAYPFIYRVTGVKSFIVSHHGVIYEKDLGPNTHVTVRSMEQFNPDRTWTLVPEQ